MTVEPYRSPTLQARRAQMFPVLADEDIARLRRFGAARRYADGECLFETGKTSPGMFVVLSGLVCVVIGSLLLIGPVDKSFYADADFELGWRIVAPVGAALALIAGTLAWKLSSSVRQPLRAGGYSLIGEVGEVRDDGTVLVAGELWKG